VLGHAGRNRSAIAEAAGPGAEVDRLARDIARARVVGAACLPGEAHAHLRQGQALALALLRAALEADNRSARLVLRDFDGRALVLQANPRHAGRGLALLRADGVPIAWPQDRAPATAHLTRVV
jgi:ATP phosphoribosyltransferase regulatory subunit HisZ